jgi:hypothetical protein
MSFMDKLKAGAGQAKDLAGQAAGKAGELAGDAASRAKQEAKELQLKRELGEAYDDLGKSAYDLWAAGAIAHPQLESRARRIQTLREELDSVQADAGDESGEAAGGEDADGATSQADPS